MMENHRTGLLWKLFMSVPEVQAGLRRLGFAARIWTPSSGDGSASSNGSVANTAMPRRRMLRSISPATSSRSARASARPCGRSRARSSPRPCSASYDPDPGLFLSLVPRLRRRHRCAAPALRRRTSRRGGAHALARLHPLQPVVAAARRPRARRGAALACEGVARLPAVPARGRGPRPVSRRRRVADTRVNPDGTLDISRWARPQHDGPPLRALALLRWVRTLRSNARGRPQTADGRRAAPALRPRLHVAHWREPSFDIWEEESASTTTRCASRRPR